MKLSKNFHLSEMTKSQQAVRMGLNNNPSEQQVENLKTLCERVLQPTREHFAKVVTVSSGFRDEVLNNALGGSKSSQHCLGMAADIEIFDVPNNELSDWIKENLMFDQLILECRWAQLRMGSCILQSYYLFKQKRIFDGH
jgi:zinc D-Ala-D-Ala carboxypeptidase